MYSFFRKSGLYTKEEGKEVLVDNIGYHLLDIIDVDNDVTLSDVISYLHKHKDQSDLYFEQYTRGYEIGPIYEEMCGEVNEETDTSFVDDIIFLEVRCIMEILEYEDDDCNLHSELQEYRTFSGVGKDNLGYALDFTPLNLLKDKGVRINNEVVLRDPKDYSKLLFKSDKEMTVSDFFGSILYEFTFHGDSNERDATWTSLVETSDSIESGEMKMYSSDHVLLTFLEMDLERLVQEEKYEKAAKVRKEIEDIKSKIEKGE